MRKGIDKKKPHKNIVATVGGLCLSMCFILLLCIVALPNMFFPIAWIVDVIVIVLTRDNVLFSILTIFILWIWHIYGIHLCFQAISCLIIQPIIITWRKFTFITYSLFPIFVYTIWKIPFILLPLLGIGHENVLFTCLTFEFVFWLTYDEIMKKKGDDFYIRILPHFINIGIMLKGMRFILFLVGIYFFTTTSKLNYLINACIASILYESLLKAFVSKRPSSS